MTKSAKKSDAGKPDVSAFSAAMIAGHPAASKLWLDIMAESTRFVSERLQEDLEGQQALLRCTKPVEVVQLQSELFRKANEQYTAEAHRLFDIMNDAAGESLKEATSKMSRAYDDVPL